MKWPTVQLGDILSLEYGRALRKDARDPEGSIPVAGSNGIDGWHNKALVKGPGIVVGRKGSSGKVTWFDKDFWPIDTTYYVRLKIECELRWVYYLLSYLKLDRLSIVTGVPGLNRNDAYKVSFGLPPLSEQRRIVEILDQADALRKKRAEADAKAARILPALFYKMFGDPLRNPHQWPVENIGSLLLLLRNGTTAPQNQEKRGYPVTRIETISEGTIDCHRVRYVELDEDEVEKWRMRAGDILFSHINSESHIGKTALYEGTPEVLIHGMNLLLMRPNPKKVLPQYLFALLNTDSVRAAYRQRCKRAVNQASLNQKDISSLAVAVAPISLQKRFCHMVEDLLAQIRLQKSTAEMIDDLFHNLLHRAFTDDLTAQWREAHMKELLEEMEQQAKTLDIPIPEDGPATIRIKHNKRRAKG